MTDDLSIRRYEPGDVEAVWAVHEQSLRASPIEFLENVPGDEDLRAIPEEYLDAGGEFLVGTVDGEVVAIGGYRPAGEGTMKTGEGTTEVGEGTTEAREGTDDAGGRTGDGEGKGADAAELRRMRVHPDHQGNGYGATLLARLETLAAERGFDRVVLETNENLTAARNLYETRGYEQLGTEPLPATGERVVRYRKEL